MPWPTKPYKEWTPDDLADLLIDPKPEENAHRDYKLCANLLDQDKKTAQDKARLDILKDIAAMANGVGGALLIGVRQTRNANGPQVAESLDGIPEEETKRYEKAIKDLVDTHLDVRPASLMFSSLDVPNDSARKILIVAVPQNTYSLSMVTLGGINQFWTRRGDDNRPMTTDEIQYAFDRMTRVRESAHDELGRIQGEFRDNKEGRRYVWFAGVPIQRGRDHVPVDINRLNDLLTLSSYRDSYPEIQRPQICTSLQNNLIPSLRGVVSKAARGEVAYAEIRRDGSIVVGLMIPDDPRKMLRLWEVYDCWSFGLHLLKDVQSNFGVSRVAIVQGGLIRCRGFYVHRCQADPSAKEILHDDIAMDSIMLPDNWAPQSIFALWARQFANYLGREKPMVEPPWVLP